MLNRPAQPKMKLSLYLPLVFLYLIVVINYMIGQIPSRVPEILKEKKFKRTVKLKEVLKIQDDGANVIFRNPRYLTLLNDGSLIFFDHPFLCRYDKDGKFIFKALKQGEGPGECKYPDYYFIDGNRIRVYSWVPPKVLEYDLNGHYLKEAKTPYHGPFVFLGLIDNRIFGIRDEIRFSEFIHKEGLFETPYTLYEISADFNSLKKICDIPMKHYIKKAHWWRRAMFVVAPSEHFLFILHTAEYGIEKLDLRTGQIERVFKRRYARLKAQEAEVEQDIYNPVPKQYLPPPFDYDFDIFWIQVYRNSLWVFTSTYKDQKELIDVFDLDGNYIDCFYLEYSNNNYYHRPFNTILSDDGFLYVPEENIETGLFSINKYAIKD